jgi:hypothetical protein
MTSTVIKKERCPNCAKLGKDNSHDNLAIYNDGHSYCYSCGWNTSISKTQKIKNFSKTKTEDKPKEVSLPEDCSLDYPERALKWIEQYELTKTDLMLHNTLWSNNHRRLIFPIYGNDANIIAYQGRDFDDTPEKTRPKWFGHGNLKGTFNILGKGSRLYLTEDIISAIKVSKCGVMSMPLYGSFVGLERFKRLYRLYGNSIGIYIWLDPDKRKEAYEEAQLGLLCGLKCSTIYSDKDPKEHSYTEIKEIINV